MKKIPCVDIYNNSYEFDEDQYVDRPSAYGIYTQSDTILMTKDKWVGEWGLPGGGVDEGETDFEALAREFVEETGLIIAQDIQQVFSDVTYFKPEGEKRPWRVLRTIYRVSVTDGEQKENGNNEEVAAVSYLQLKEAIVYLSQSQSNSVVAKLLQSFIT